MAVKWTEEMDNFLRANYSKSNKRELAKQMGVSRNILLRRAKDLNLKTFSRIGGKYYSSDEVEAIIKLCRKNTQKVVAEKLGIKKSSLVMFLRRKSILITQPQEEKQKKIEAHQRKIHRKRLKKIKELQDKKTKALSVKPLRCRLRHGEYYYVPFEHRMGGYKVKETNSKYDEEMFNKGWYFETEHDATVFSFLTQRDEGAPDYENL